MPALPSGTVTFVFSDIEDSTALVKQLGERYDEVLTTHRRLIREGFAGYGGVEIDTQGDAFFFAFPRARDAVTAAVEAQRAHADHDWPEGVDVRVRMGLHTGEPAVGTEGYLGLDVVRAARLCTTGVGGHVLLSEATRALVGSSLPEGVSIFPVGERQLKGIDEPERVFELDIDGVARSEEPVQAPAPTADEAAWEADFGKRLSEQIEASVRRSLESSLDRAKSAVDSLAERASKRPGEIAERLEDER